MQRKLKIILVLVSIAMSFLGATFWVVLQNENNLNNNVVVDLDNENVQETLDGINFKDFHPGHNEKYEITLKGDLSDDYEVTLDFHEIKSEGKDNALANYINVKIETQEKTIEKGLKELLDGKQIELGKKASTIDITYYMPEDVGNESQGTSVEFYIELTAKSVKE